MISSERNVAWCFMAFIIALVPVCIAVAYVSDSMLPACFGFTVFYAFITVKAMIRYGILNLYSIYLYTSFFFIYSKFFFTLIGYSNFLLVEFPGRYLFSNETGIILFASVFISHFLMDIMYSFLYRRVLSESRKIKHNERLQNLGLIIMAVSFFPLMYKLYMQLQVVRTVRYVAIYMGALSDIKYPAWTAGSGTFFYAGFLLVLMSCPTIKIYLCSAALFFVFLFSGSMQGGRGGLLAGTVALLYFFQFFSQRKISFAKIGIIFAFLVLIAMFLGQTRSGTKSHLPLSDGMIRFLEGQSVSVASPLAIIERKDEQARYRKYPYIFSILFTPYYNLVSPETKNVPSVNRVFTRNEIESIITYIYSPYMFLHGFGVGSTFLGEMYDFGGILGVIFWTIILCRLICWIQRKSLQKNRNLLMSWFVVSCLPLLPRDHFFTFITASFRYIIFIFLILVFINTLAYPKRIRVEVKK